MKWQLMETAPKDGTPVLLLVRAEPGGLFNPMENENYARTIGQYGVNGGPEVDPTWSFPGWNWCQDCFEGGLGEPVAWQPLPSIPREGEIE